MLVLSVVDVLIGRLFASCGVFLPVARAACTGLSAGCRHTQTRKQPHFIFDIIDSLFFQMCPLAAFWGVTLHQTSLGAMMSSVTFIDFLG